MQKNKEPVYRITGPRVRALVNAAVVLAAIVLIALMVVGAYDMRRYYIISLIIAILCLALFFARFEGRRLKSRDIVIPAVITAIAVASRLIFFAVPQFKPIAAVVILAGISFGAETGFMTGALSMFVSNMFLGQGPWTPWQMLGLGLVGFLAGVIFRRESFLKPWLMALYGAISILTVYGFIVDTYSAFGFIYEPTLTGILAVYAAGIPFNAVFALCTALALLMFGKPMIKKLKRVKLKYGIK